MTRIAIVAAGGMGAALGERLVRSGAQVITSLQGRSQASRERAKLAGMVDVGDNELASADIILSVVPPDQALPLATRIANLVTNDSRKPIYVDCNAVSPRLASAVGEAVEASGMRFVDAGIIGLPPKPLEKGGPVIYLSGADAQRAAAISSYGVATNVLDAPNGAASALKMSYAGITKGLIALAATMALASRRYGVADALTAELLRSQPALAQSFGRSVPDMLPKARRWVPEMHQIAEFVGSGSEAGAYEAFAGLYQRISDGTAEAEVLKPFFVQEPPRH